MAVHVRLMRMGKKKQAFYRIVATDSRRSRDGRFLEIVGTYNPITKPAEVMIHEDKLTKWLDDGAQLTDTVKSLLTQIGFVEKYNSAKDGKDVSEMTLKTTIIERKKKTRKMKKAALSAETEKKAEAETAAAAKTAKAAEEKKAKAAAAAKTTEATEEKKDEEKTE